MSRISRRGLLYGAGIAAAVAAGGVGASRAFADPVGDTPRFDLSADAIRTKVFEKPMTSVTVMQAFAFDDTHQTVYITQLMDANGGSGDHNKNGDLCVNRVTMDGEVTGWMYLRGFGHGVALGIEPDGDGAVLWIEADAHDTGGDFTFGRKIARIPFAHKGDVAYSKVPEADRFDPVPGCEAVTPSVDLEYGRFAVKYADAGKVKFHVYDLDDFKAKKFTPIASFDKPSRVANGVYFQGWGLFGRYLYALEGSNWGTQGSTKPDGNVYLSSIDIESGEMKQHCITRAAKFFDYREPEGIAIRRGTPGDPSTAVLHFGLASGVRGDRRATLYTKSELINP